MPRYRRGFDVDQAHDWLSRRDRRLGTWMKRLGPIQAQPGWAKTFDPVDALARAILFQQLSGKAASTIVGRVETAIGSPRLHADTLARIDDAGLRVCAQRVDKAERMPTPKELLARGEKWGPFRTYASLYLWRIADFTVDPKTTTNRSQG